MDLHRFTTTTHHFEPPPLPPQNRKFSSRSNLNICISLSLSLPRFFFVFFVVLFLHCLFIPCHSQSGQHQHHPVNINKRMILPIKRQTPAGIVVDKKQSNILSPSYLNLIIIIQLTEYKLLHLIFKHYHRHPAANFFLFFRINQSIIFQFLDEKK